MISRLRTLDPWLFVLPLVLMVVSVLMIYSLDPVAPLALRQLVYAGVGVVALLVAGFIDYRAVAAWSGWLFAANLFLLALVPFIGSRQFGAKLWINVGPVQFEPGELMKLTAILLIARLASRSPSVSNRQFIVVSAVVLVSVGAIILQPDLGTALIILASTVGILLQSGTTRLQKGMVVGSLLVGAVIFSLSFANVPPFKHVLKEYQKDRLASFIQPARDPSGTGYNVLQSVIAVGSGGVSGQGLGNGSQSQLNFLPVAHADFIFAVIGETWGLVGTWGILIVYLVFVLRILQAARIAKDRFGMLLCVGIAVKFTFEILVNIGMNMRLMPVTGIPLPFLSYGGTTMLTNALATGLVQSVALRYKRLTF